MELPFGNQIKSILNYIHTLHSVGGGAASELAQFTLKVQTRTPIYGQGKSTADDKRWKKKDKVALKELTMASTPLAANHLPGQLWPPAVKRP